MNIDNILRLAGYLDALHEAAPARFNMNQWYAEHPCGTIGCIAGHAMVLLDPRGAQWDWRPTEAARHLGIVDESAYFYGGELASKLFAPNEEELIIDCGLDYHRVRANHAAKVLRHLAATGEVDWSVAFGEGK
jgi:hypothetical protein